MGQNGLTPLPCSAAVGESNTPNIIADEQREGREALPPLLPAVCPCGAVCGAFPSRVASQPQSTPKRHCRGLWGACAARAKTGRTVGTQRGRGAILVPDKDRGSRCGPRSVHTAPQCGSGQRFPGISPRGQCGGTFWASGVRFAPAWPGPPVGAEFLRVPGGGMVKI